MVIVREADVNIMAARGALSTVNKVDNGSINGFLAVNCGKIDNVDIDIDRYYRYSYS